MVFVMPDPSSLLFSLNAAAEGVSRGPRQLIQNPANCVAAELLRSSPGALAASVVALERRGATGSRAADYSFCSVLPIATAEIFPFRATRMS
jgi:hypothetical protein